MMFARRRRRPGFPSARAGKPLARARRRFNRAWIGHAPGRLRLPFIHDKRIIKCAPPSPRSCSRSPPPLAPPPASPRARSGCPEARPRLPRDSRISPVRRIANTVCSAQSVGPPGVPRLCNSQQLLAEERAAAAPVHRAGQATAVEQAPVDARSPAHSSSASGRAPLPRPWPQPRRLCTAPARAPSTTQDRSSAPAAVEVYALFDPSDQPGQLPQADHEVSPRPNSLLASIGGSVARGYEVSGRAPFLQVEALPWPHSFRQEPSSTRARLITPDRAVSGGATGGVMMRCARAAGHALWRIHRGIKVAPCELERREALIVSSGAPGTKSSGCTDVVGAQREERIQHQARAGGGARSSRAPP